MLPCDFDGKWLTVPDVPLHAITTTSECLCWFVADIRLDIVDSAGGHMNNVQADLYRSPVDVHGNAIFKGYYNYVPSMSCAL